MLTETEIQNCKKIWLDLGGKEEFFEELFIKYRFIDIFASGDSVEEQFKWVALIILIYCYFYSCNQKSSTTKQHPYFEKWGPKPIYY